MSPLNHKDFRSGNLVKFDGRIFEIDTIAKEFPTLNTDEFGIGVVTWNNIEPIPLSEDVLIKLGFKKSRGPYRYELNGIFINVLITDSGTSFWLNGSRPIHWVHKLQNYYYENRNAELIYTP